MIDMIQNR